MIYEHRTVSVIPGRKEAHIAHLNEWFPILEKYGAKVIGIFQPVIGNSNETSFMLVFDDLAHYERVFQSMEEGEDYKKMRERWAKEGPNVYNISIKILKSTEYSASK